MSTTNKDSKIADNEDFAPPPGPPPPIMPEGWVARFDDRYQRFYYVNIATKKSQWDKPPGTVDAPVLGRVSGESDKPPSYVRERSSSPRPKSIHDQRQEPANQQPIESFSHPQHLTQPPCFSTPEPTVEPKSSSRGIAGRLSSLLKPRSPKSNPNYQQQQYCDAQQGYGPQQGYYQQQGRPVYVQSDPGYAQGPRRSRMGGLGVGGAAALGAGGGLLGGLLLADAFEDHDDYQQGFEDGADYGGGDYGGGDYGGGDF